MAAGIGTKLVNSIESTGDGGKQWASKALHEGLEFAKQGADKVIAGLGDAIENDMASGAVIAGAGLIPVVGPAVSIAMGALKVGYNYALKGSKDYKSADPYLDGNLRAAAIVNCGGDVKKEKVRRRKEREKLIAAGKTSPDKKHRDAAERLERDMVGVERARLSKHVYEQYGPEKQPPAPPPVGYLIPSKNDLNALGVTQDDLAPINLPFRAQIYKVDPEVGSIPPEYVTALRGTESGKDWTEGNIPQGLGFESPIYSRAMALARKLKRIPSLSMEFTGHSMAGGMVSAVSRLTGFRGTTQNSAVLMDATTARGGHEELLSRNALKLIVNAYRIEDVNKSELLSSINNMPFVPEMIGTVRPLAAPKAGVSRLGLHSIDAVIDSLEEQKKSDQQVLGARDNL